MSRFLSSWHVVDCCGRAHLLTSFIEHFTKKHLSLFLCGFAWSKNLDSLGVPENQFENWELINIFFVIITHHTSQSVFSGQKALPLIVHWLSYEFPTQFTCQLLTNQFVHPMSVRCIFFRMPPPLLWHCHNLFLWQCERKITVLISAGISQSRVSRCRQIT